MQWAFDVGTNWKTIDVSFQRIAHIMDGGHGLAEQQSGTHTVATPYRRLRSAAVPRFSKFKKLIRRTC